MNKLYVIQWKSKVNGRAGKGTKLFEFEEGQLLVEELNHEYPQIQHELLEHRPPPEPAEPAPVETEHSEHSEEPIHQPAPVH